MRFREGSIMEKVYMVDVNGSELTRSIILSVDGINQTFYVPENTLSKVPLKLTDQDNDGIKYATAFSFTCRSLKFVAGDGETVRSGAGYYRMDQTIRGQAGIYLFYKAE